MTRPPLYVRRPFLAGLLRQLPLLVVLVAVAVGLLLVTFEHWRRGLVVMGLALIGAAVLDVGVSRVDGRIAGDVAPGVVDVAGFVAPNPGGVGPMTRAMLLANVVAAAEQAAAVEALTA